jgi:PAS domain S-box-containing protein
LQVNPSKCEITGYTEEELLATDFQSITHPDDLETGLEGLRRLLSGEIQYCYLEKRYVHKSGRIVWARVSTSLVSDAGGDPLYIVAQVQDITEARADKENLEHLIRQNRSILTSVGEGIYGLDLDERTSFVNPAAERMLGYGAGELAGRHQHVMSATSKPRAYPTPRASVPSTRPSGTATCIPPATRSSGARTAPLSPWST